MHRLLNQSQTSHSRQLSMTIFDDLDSLFIASDKEIYSVFSDLSHLMTHQMLDKHYLHYPKQLIIDLTCLKFATPTNNIYTWHWMESVAKELARKNTSKESDDDSKFPMANIE